MPILLQPQLQLLTDLLTCMNSGVSYSRPGISAFSTICAVLCRFMAHLSTDELSRKVFTLTVSFLALMSSSFMIEPLAIDALISGLIAFHDPDFITSLYDRFIDLLAGRHLARIHPNFIVRQPPVLKSCLTHPD
jgi:hypothetical protein